MPLSSGATDVSTIDELRVVGGAVRLKAPRQASSSQRVWGGVKHGDDRCEFDGCSHSHDGS